MSDFTFIKLNKTTPINTFKQVVLTIIVASEFAVEFNEANGPVLFRKNIGSYDKPGKGEKAIRSKGGVKYVGNMLKAIKAGTFKLDDLTTYYNEIQDTLTIDVCRKVADCLGMASTNRVSQQKCLDYINTFTPCQYLFSVKWPSIHHFVWSFVKEDTPSSPNLAAFAAGSVPLVRCYVGLLGEPKLIRKLPKPSEPPLIDHKPIHAGTLPDKNDEYCIGHYLDLKREAVLAKTTLTWQDAQLIDVLMVQERSYNKRGNPRSFQAVSGGIVHSDRIVFVTLKSDAQPQFDLPAVHLQITIERDANSSGQRTGMYSSTYYTGRNHNSPVSVSGAVILQNDPGNSTLNKLADDLSNYTNGLPVNELHSDALAPQQRMVQDAWAIRYRLNGQIAHLPYLSVQAKADSEKKFQRYIGKYVCHYMRLAKRPARFELSRIEIFPDGSATLDQRQQDGNDFDGYIRIDRNRVWLSFSYNDQVGHESIRFIVDDVDTSSEQPILRGVFSSETNPGNLLVSGRMSMRKVTDWTGADSSPVKYTDITHANFSEEGDDLAFFTKGYNDETVQDFNLTDGPVWAEVAKRLTKRSALGLLTQLCSNKAIDNKLFNDNHFYYYTFKADPIDEAKYMIERNLVSFNPNGKVTITVSPTVKYEGYAYHSTNTLRLSLYDHKNGFLELFLELQEPDRPDLSRCKYLFGMSLWHSGSRLQGKTVVLARCEPNNYDKVPKFFTFFDNDKNKTFDKERKELLDEDKRSGGVISYLRGEINRYMHTTTRSSPNQIRPRDKRFREIHFLIACYYGSLSPTDKNLAAARDHLKQSYIHGYACQFAGLSVDPAKAFAPEPPQRHDCKKYVADLYKSQFPDADITGDKTVEIIRRIRQIAREQLELQRAVVEGGELAHLHDIAHTLWPELIGKKEE